MKGIGSYCQVLISLSLLIVFLLIGCHAKDNVLFERGQTALKNGRFDEAIEAFSALVRDFPQSSLREESLFRLGDIYYRYNKDPEKSIEYYSQIMNSYPDSVFICDIHLNIGNMYLKMFEEHEKAVEEYQIVLVHCSGPDKKALAQVRIGDCYFETGRYQQAIIEYRLVNTDFTDSPYTKTAFKKVADCYFIIGEMKNAEIFYRKTLDLMSEEDYDEAVKISLAQVLVNVTEYCMAADIYRELLEREPDRIDIQRLSKKAEKKCQDNSVNENAR